MQDLDLINHYCALSVYPKIVIYINCGFDGFALMLLSPGIRIDLLYGYINFKLLRKFQIYLMISGANPLNTTHPSDAYP